MTVTKQEEYCGLTPHSHIKGLGFTEDRFEYISEGLVGQLSARKALQKIHDLVKTSKGGRIILLAGESGTGKSALAYALAKSLGNDTVFTQISATEIYSKSISRTEFLLQVMRRSIGLTVHENVKVIEGEVVSLHSNRLVLKTLDMESSFVMGVRMKRELEREKVTIGDIVRIIKERGRIVKLGAPSAKPDKALLGDIKFMPCPEGELMKIIDEEEHITLHDIDVINDRTHGYLALFSGDLGEVRSEVRAEVNNKVCKWVLEGKAEIRRGVLFIDESDMLDYESFGFLCKVIEDSFAPIIVFSSSNKEACVRGTGKKEPYGMPRDIAERVLVIETDKPNKDDIKNILSLRMAENEINIDEECFDILVPTVLKSGLRYGLSVIDLAESRRSLRGTKTVTIDDIKKVCEVFLCGKIIREDVETAL